MNHHLAILMMTFNDIIWKKRCKCFPSRDETIIEDPEETSNNEDCELCFQCRMDKHSCPFCISIGSDVCLHIGACDRCYEYSVPSPLFCRHCFRFLCAGCADVDYCFVCKKLNCDFCSFVRRCDKCTKPMCNKCDKKAHGSTCPTKNCLCHSRCGKCGSEINDSFVCDECIPSEWCYQCNQKYCRKCTTVTDCDLCDKTYCTECCQVWKCESCERLCCGTCSIVNMSDTCTKEWKCMECSCL